MRPEHPLGFSGSARGIDENPDVRRANIAGGLKRRACGNESFVLPVALSRSADNKVALRGDPAEFGSYRVDGFRKLLVNEEGDRIGIVYDIFYLPANKPEVYGNDNDSGFGGRKIEFDEFYAVFQQYGDLVAFLYPQGRRLSASLFTRSFVCR